MRLLLIDTCGDVGSIALADTTCESAVTARATLPGRTASERLLATIRDLLTEQNIGLAALDAIVVVNGPGSFTGVRVGLSAAKGLSEALNLPVIALSRLAVLAEIAEAPEAARICAVLDAGRGEFYSGFYTNCACQGEGLLSKDELFAAVETKNPTDPTAVIVCEPAVQRTLGALTPQLVLPPTAADALRPALRRLKQRAFDDASTLDANYLRRTDAEIFAKPKMARSAKESHAGSPTR